MSRVPDARGFELRDGKLLLPLDGDDLQVLDAMGHRYARGYVAGPFERARVERLRDVICDALDRFYGFSEVEEDEA